MADIKTRDVTRGYIKTLDRAASSMHHMKEETIRSKAMEISSRQHGENGDAYAQEMTEHYAGSVAAVSAQTGAELILRNRNKSPEASSYPESREDQIRRAFREQGVRTIRGRQEKAKLADAEALRNTEEVRFTGRIRSAFAGKNAGYIQRNSDRSIGKRRVASKGVESIQRSRKELAVKRIVSKNDAVVHPLRSLLGIGRTGANRRRASTASRFMTYLWENARTTIATVGAGGIATIITLTLLVFFGIGILTFSNNSPDTSVTDDPDAIEYFIPDLAGSPTREAIVKAAAREVGNVGGEKFWRWYGFNSHVHWCACFTSYIAAECGCIQSGVCPKSAIVDDWISFYKKQHRWAGRNYIPHSGDFILFDWEGDGQPDHIGIVESCDGKTVHTIEGNSRDVCRRKTYTRGSGLIYGYGCPNYSGT